MAKMMPNYKQQRAIEEIEFNAVAMSHAIVKHLGYGAKAVELSAALNAVSAGACAAVMALTE